MIQNSRALPLCLIQNESRIRKPFSLAILSCRHEIDKFYFYFLIDVFAIIMIGNVLIVLYQTVTVEIFVLFFMVVLAVIVFAFGNDIVATCSMLGSIQ